MSDQISTRDDEALAFLAERLAAPLPYRWRLQSVANKVKSPYPEGTRGSFIAYITARDVMNRLDDVLGFTNWKSRMRETADGGVICGIEIRVGDDWIIKEDIGYPNNPGSDQETEPLKAAASDALKRAGVQFGIGRFLYEMPAVWTGIDQWGKPLQPIEVKSGARPAVTGGETVDPESGEIHEAPPAQENAPCAIDGCRGVCEGKWVDYSVRRYGVTLCGRHSAMAKRNELDSELEQLNHGGAAPVSSAPRTPAPAAKSELDWNKFWPLAKGVGVPDAAAYLKLTGVRPDTMTPDAAHDLMHARISALKS